MQSTVELKGGNNFTTVGIDTGEWLDIAIAPEAVAKLRVRFTGTVTEANNAAGNKFQGLREFRILALQLGGVTFRNILGYERVQIANGDSGGAPPFDASIGRGFLERYTLVVDYPHSALSFTRRHAGARFAEPQRRCCCPLRTDSCSLAILLGEAWLFASITLLKYPLAVFLVFHLFVLFYEEPALESRFGEAYRVYRPQAS